MALASTRRPGVLAWLLAVAALRCQAACPDYDTHGCWRWSEPGAWPDNTVRMRERERERKRERESVFSRIVLSSKISKLIGP